MSEPQLNVDAFEHVIEKARTVSARWRLDERHAADEQPMQPNDSFDDRRSA